MCPSSVRLSPATLDQTAGLPELKYDRASLRPGIVHLGLGAFHRAHQAVFTHNVLSQLPADEAAKWGTVGVSMRSRTMSEQLGPQEGLYTVHERSSGETNVVLIGSVLRCVVAGEDPAGVVELLASPDVRIVSLTVTEKGYCYDPATRELDLSNADVVHDLDPANAAAPRSAIGVLVAALRLRRDRGVEPFTALSCDNLPHNGQTLRGCCLTFARRVDPALADWLGAAVKFPCTMVDGIVPATTREDVDSACARDGPLRGVTDEAVVVCEPFRQWVVEDDFGPLGRPPWELAGAQLTADVAPFEVAKLQCLNGCHSTLAYVGNLCGCDAISDVMTDPALAALARALLRLDVLPALKAPDGVDLVAYADTILRRFSNTALKHKTAQIATDGSQKLPQRILTTARTRLAAASRAQQEQVLDAVAPTAPSPDSPGSPAAPLAVVPLTIAAWMRYVTRTDAAGEPVRVADPLASKFAAIAADAKGDADAILAAMLALAEVFGDDDLRRDDRFVGAVRTHLRALVKAEGPEATKAYVESVVAGLPAVPAAD
mmetsp:Transcript_5994/g.17865  ORF Transcript_5994/g.17865 Transcript_5994/m.17865 type:complete len:546 (+) Transcript_5994:122-1759(+)